MTTPVGNARLRAARQALGIRSQAALADAVTNTARGIGLRISINPRTVRRWESASPPWPHPEHARALEAVFHRPLTELGFTPPWADEQSTRQVHGLAPTTHPDSSQPIHQSGRQHLLFPPLLQPITQRSPLAIGVSTGPFRLRDCTDQLLNMPTLAPSSSRTCRPRTGHSSPPQYPNRVSSQAVSNSSTSNNLNSHNRASPLLSRPLTKLTMPCSAQQRWHIWLLLLRSPAKSHAPRMHATRSELPEHSPGAPTRPLIVLAWLDAVEAEVETRFGDTRRALRLIHHAEQVLASTDDRPSPDWFDWFSKTRLDGFKGNTLMVAGQGRAARETLEARTRGTSRRCCQAEGSYSRRSCRLRSHRKITRNAPANTSKPRSTNLAITGTQRPWIA